MQTPCINAPILVLAGFAMSLLALPDRAAPTSFHNAPDSAAQLVNPFAGQPAAAAAGGALYAAHCAACHGRNAEGSGNIPPLARSAVQSAADGEIFWFITTGSVNDGMPSWASLPEPQRWQIVAYLKTPLTATTAARAP